MTISKPTKHRIPGLSCPQCNGPAGIRNSAALTTTVRYIRYRCDNDECCHVFFAELQVIRTIVPSAPSPPDRNRQSRLTSWRNRTGSVARRSTLLGVAA